MKAKSSKKNKKEKKGEQDRDNNEDDDYYVKSDYGSSNSDDSDDETNMTEKELALRETVLVFFNTVSSTEMQSMININKKKLNSLIERRPFKDYKDLV